MPTIIAQQNRAHWQDLSSPEDVRLCFSHLTKREVTASPIEPSESKRALAHVIEKNIYGEDYGKNYISAPWKDGLVVEHPLPLSEQMSAGATSTFQRHPDPIALIDESVSNIPVIGIVTSNTFQEQTNLTVQISRATSHENIFDLLDLTGREKIASRLRYLHEITKDNDPEDPAMKFISLRELARFFISEGDSLPTPEIGISPSGLLQAEWHLSKASALMKFLPDGNVRFAATSGRRPIQGEDSKEVALEIVRPYIS